MKNIFLIIISFILLSNVSKAQLDDNTKQQIVLVDFLMKSPITYVVLEDSAVCAYNDAIKYAVGRHWKINKIEYITVAEYKKKKLINVPYIKRRTEDESETYYKGYTPIHKEYIGLYYDDEKIRYTRIHNYLTEDQKGKVPVKFSAVKAIKEFNRWINYYKNVKATGSIPKDNTTHEQTLKRIQESTLVISEKDLGDDVQTEAKIKAIYPYKIKIVTDEELFQIIDATEPEKKDILYVEATRPSRILKEYRKEVRQSSSSGTDRWIIDPNTLEKIYTNPRAYKSSASVGFTDDDFQMIAKQKLNAYSRINFYPYKQ